MLFPPFVNGFDYNVLRVFKKQPTVVDMFITIHQLLLFPVAALTWFTSPARTLRMARC